MGGLSRLQVPEVTQDSQGPTGSPEAGVHQETRAHPASPARPSEMKVIDSVISNVCPHPGVPTETRPLPDRSALPLGSHRRGSAARSGPSACVTGRLGSGPPATAPPRGLAVPLTATGMTLRAGRASVGSCPVRVTTHTIIWGFFEGEVR